MLVMLIKILITPPIAVIGLAIGWQIGEAASNLVDKIIDCFSKEEM